ncbi:hypothetical protein Tco_0080246 [Tanacetum coccineum]
MDNPNLTMEEYIRLEEEKDRKRRKVFNWQTATYGKIRVVEDIHDRRSVETEFPAIDFNNEVSSKTLSYEPTITILKTNTPYPSRKIRRIRACTHQRPQRNKAQYAVSRENQYAVFNILEDIKHGPYSNKSLIRRIQYVDTPINKEFGKDDGDQVDIEKFDGKNDFGLWQVSGSGADGRDCLVDFEEYDGGNILLGDGREFRVRRTGKVQVQMRDGSSFVLDNVSQAVTRKTLKGRKQLGEYQTWWKIKTGNVLDSCNQMSTQQCMKSGVTKHLGVVEIQQQNGLVKETNVTLLAKGVEFEMEPQEDHAFEVELLRNVDQGVGSQKVQTQDLIYYHLAHDREKHSAHELFGYREDSNEAAFAVVAAEKIYTHGLINFNDTVACEVIFKWKTGLKEEMDVWSDVYMLSNGCKKSSDNKNDYYWEYAPGMFIHLSLYIDGMILFCGCMAEIWVTKGLLDKVKRNILGMEIVRNQGGNTLRVSQSRFYNGKLVHTSLEGHFILSLEGSLSGDCDVEKNGKWSCIYAVGSQEYQMVCTRLDIASADVGLLNKFDRGLQTDPVSTPLRVGFLSPHLYNKEVRGELFPSVEKERKLHQILPKCDIRTFNDTGYAKFLEEGFDLVTVIKGAGFYGRTKHTDFLPPSSLEIRNIADPLTQDDIIQKSD